MVLAFAFLYLSHAEAQVRGSRTPAPSPVSTPGKTVRGGRVLAPGQSARAPSGETRFSYFTCNAMGSAGPVNFWLGDYQGKQSLRLSGSGVGAMARDYYVPVNITMKKSADGSKCNVSVLRVKGKDPLTFQFPMAQGPNFLKRTNTSSGKSPPCSSYETPASAALKSCTTPPVLTRQTMNASCNPAGPSVNELAYSCQKVSQYTKRAASAYSIKYCQDGPRGSEARTDNICVARILCNRRPRTSEDAYTATKDWGKQYDSYMSCRPNASGQCDKTVDECRADKSTYFTNRDRGEAVIYLDVGISTGAPAPASAPAPAVAPPVAENPWAAELPAPQVQPEPQPPQPATRFDQPVSAPPRAGDVFTGQRQRWPTPPRRSGAQ